jgi:hypothetical protein
LKFDPPFARGGGQNPRNTALKRRVNQSARFKAKVASLTSAWQLVRVALGLLATAFNLSAQPKPGANFELNTSPGADLFANRAPVSLHIEIVSANLEVLRKESREFVPATVTEHQTVYTNVAVHLKGSIGSFRPVEDKPSWTLDFSRFNSNQRFHGLRRIHLNNSVEDPSYCNEQLGSELFRSAGVPAPRVMRAAVSLNGRRLGLYVLKEGFTEDFLSCYFAHPSGNLYEPDEGHDVNQRLKRNSVQAPRKDRAGLRALANAVLDSNPLHRWEGLEKVLATDEFISFMATEVILCHRDGYCLARNNFRLYEDFETGKISFFPHGMDQLWGNPAAPWRPQMAGLAARAVIETPEGRTRYRERLGNLVTNLLQPDLLARRVDQLVAELHPFADAGEFAGIQKEAALLKDRIAQRRASLDSQLGQPELKAIAFDHGRVQLEGWTKFEEPSSGSMESCNSPDGIQALHILTHSETVASWRTRVLLNRGHYRFEGRARVSAVKPLPFGTHQGAGMRVGGSTRQSANLVGDASWTTLKAEFQIETDASEAEFICELRATAGEAWFDTPSLKLLRLP